MIIRPRQHQRELIDSHKSSGCLGTLAWHGMGCLVGETKIQTTHNGRKHKPMRIDEVLAKIEKGSWKMSNLKARSYKGSGIGLNRVTNIFFSGVKQCYSMCLADGKEIVGTADHKIFTKDGWKKLSDCLNLDVAIDVPRIKEAKLRDTYMTVGEYHPHRAKIRRKDCVGECYKLHLIKHRGIYEAHINGLTLEEFKVATRDEKRAKKLKYIDPTKYHIHHINMDHSDHRPENMIHIPVKEHNSFHSKLQVIRSVAYVKCVSITPVGKKKTYDLTMLAPHNNYVANGIVVHNSGKTLAALWAFRDLKKTLKAIGVPAPKALIIVPKSAVFTWRAEIKANTPDLINDCIILPYSQLHHAHNRLKYADIRNIIFDESHYLKAPHKQTNRVQSLANFFEALHNMPTKFAYGRIFSLTGTPTPNGAFEMYNQWAMCTAPNCLEIANRLRDDSAYGKWKESFSKKKLNKWRGKGGKQRQGNEHQGVDNVEMYSQLLESFVHYRAVDDCLDLPKGEDIMVNLNIPDDRLLADVNLEEPESFMALQERLARAKEPYLYEWIKEFLDANKEEQLIVFSQYTWPLYEIQKKFGKNFVIITGQEADFDRKQALEAFQQGKIQCIALSYRCGSESLNLQNARYTVYHGFPWHDDALAQAMARTRRSGQTRKTFHYFLMSGHNDIKVYNLVRSKKDANDSVKCVLREANPFVKEEVAPIAFMDLF